MTGIFKPRENAHDNLRQLSQFRTRSIITVFKGIESISYLGPLIWWQVPLKKK